MSKKSITATLFLLSTVLGYLCLAYMGVFGELEGPGELTTTPRPEFLATRAQTTQERAAAALGQAEGSQILFGDLHAHSTYSIDAFQYSLRMMGGYGSRPPADACDFARYCSALDFFAIADHAEHSTPEHWRDTRDVIRQCNAVSGSVNPDLVAFLGYEWTQAGTTPDNHFGHKNVVFLNDAEGSVPTRPIYAKAPGIVNRTASPAQRLILPFLDFGDRQRVFDFNKLTDTVYSVPECPENVHAKDLPENCREGVATPKELFAKLDEWGHDAMVIPHGNAWGIYTPPGSTWDKQLKDGNHRPDYQFMMEVFSGHGNSEEYRSWKSIELSEDGTASCPQPTEAYLPTCWRAGEIIRQRCLAGGSSESECELRAAETRQLVSRSGVAGHNVVRGLSIEGWLDAGQCRDCFLPAFNYRPGGTAQYALSLTDFSDPDLPARFNFALIGSSDNHVARPGAGYKEFDRYGNTETSGVQEAFARKLVYPSSEYSDQPSDGDHMSLPPIKKFEHERSSSFFYTGGLVAVHATGRDRDAIWESLQSKQVYGTSGQRILLWFDLLNGPNGAAPMGSALKMPDTPRFRVSALGAFKQKPGCPDYVFSGLSSERVDELCGGECFNPDETRQLISRIEVIRVRPQTTTGESIALPDGTSRIQDAWKVFECEPDPNGCTVEFEDPDFSRDTNYYVRAIQQEAPHINAGTLRAFHDEAGSVLGVSPCYSDKRTDPDDNCLASKEGRAWSSPIFLEYVRDHDSPN